MKQLLQHWVTGQAESRPDSRCVVFGNQVITYAELEQRSNQLANLLREGGCQKGDRVCILMPKSPEAILGMIGTLKAGCMHVPIDIASPAARVGRILDSCDNRWILAAGPVTPLLTELLADRRFRDRISVGCLDPGNPADSLFAPAFRLDDVLRAPVRTAAADCASTDAAHILFTSGSTGTPKGVVITHANVIAFVHWALEHFSIDHTDRFSGHTPFHFDLSTFDIFGTLAAGAELHLVPPGVATLPPKLVRFIRDSQLTQWFSVPSVLNYIAKFDALRPGDFPSLRRVLWCGEVLPTPALIYWMKRLPHVRFTNLYGPTEATIASSFYDVPACPQSPREQIPIGRACGGEELLVLDEDMDPALPNRMGNLYIGGAGLSPGYWRDAEKTAAAFVPDPRASKRTGTATDSGEHKRLYRTGDLVWADDSGCIFFVGRSDTQIKSRGYRIELGEIETALNSCEALQECAVVAIQAESFGGWMICCAYVVRAGATATQASLRAHLEKLLPAYMLPVRWTQYPALPKNANGKIDRPRLKDSFVNAEPLPANSTNKSPVLDQSSSSNHRESRHSAPDSLG
jgi:amino acid adenylation domain-containing protein